MLPTDDKARKALPLWTFLMEYFPDTFVAVANVAVIGNNQHNPGQPLHWAREKSTDQMNTAFRHMFDHGRGTVKDTDGAYHLAKAIWRLSAELQLLIENEPIASVETGQFTKRDDDCADPMFNRVADHLAARHSSFVPAGPLRPCKGNGQWPCCLFSGHGGSCDLLP